MRTKNAKSITAAESAHLALVKSLPCSVCDANGGIAHHINQGQHWTTVALCEDCHVGSRNGWHGQRILRNIRKLDELAALNITLQRIEERT